MKRYPVVIEQDSTITQYNRIVEIKRLLRRWQKDEHKKSIHIKLVYATVSWIDVAIGRENRNQFLSDTFGRNIASSKELTVNEAFGLIMWAVPVKNEATGEWHPSPEFEHDITLLRQVYGQLPIPTKTGEQNGE